MRSRAPVLNPSVRVRTETLDRFLSAVGEVILSSSQLRTGVARYAHDPEVVDGFDRVDRRVAELQRRVLDLRTAPLVRVTDNLPRTARQLAEKLGKRVEVEIVGAELELDRSILDRLSEPLLHLVRNAVDHGLEKPADRLAAGKPEAGRIRIEARRQKDSIVIEVRDDGRGIDLATGRAPGDRGRADPSGPRGGPARGGDRRVHLPSGPLDGPGGLRGVGPWRRAWTPSRRRSRVSEAASSCAPSSGSARRPRSGCPSRRPCSGSCCVRIAEERVAIPIAKVERILEVSRDAIESAAGDQFALVDGEPIPVLSLARQLRIDAPEPLGDAVPLVITEVRGERIGLLVDRFEGQQEIYVKPVPDLLGAVRILAGLTVLEDGSPVFLIDLNHLV